jgi:hypothetical protein
MDTPPLMDLTPPLSIFLYDFLHLKDTEEIQPQKPWTKLEFFYNQLLEGIHYLSSQTKPVKIPWVCKDYYTFIFFLEFDIISHNDLKEFLDDELFLLEDVVDRENFLKICSLLIDCIQAWRYSNRHIREMMELVWELKSEDEEKRKRLLVTTVE